jgi:hypothetical protein
MHTDTCAQQNSHAVLERDKVRADKLDEEHRDQAQTIGDATRNKASDEANHPAMKTREMKVCKLL